MKGKIENWITKQYARSDDVYRNEDETNNTITESVTNFKCQNVDNIIADANDSVHGRYLNKYNLKMYILVCFTDGVCKLFNNSIYGIC